jgi:hypothetical protein
MDKIYIIYDTNRIWSIAYISFELALLDVQRKVHQINEQYMKTDQFELNPILPASMEDDFDKSKANNGVIVANINDYEILIYIKYVLL